MCLPSHTAPHLYFSITYKRSLEFQMEIKIICRRGFGSQTTQIVVISRCCFAWDGQEMYKVLKRTCWAIVLPIRSFVFSCPRYRRRRGLLKVPILSRIVSSRNRFRSFPQPASAPKESLYPEGVFKSCPRPSVYLWRQNLFSHNQTLLCNSLFVFFQIFAEANYNSVASNHDGICKKCDNP